MEEELGEVPSSKEEDEAGVEQLVGVVLRRSSGDAPAKGRVLNGREEGRAPPWLELERERGVGESEGERVSMGRSFPGRCRAWLMCGAREVRWQQMIVRVTCV